MCGVCVGTSASSLTICSPSSVPPLSCIRSHLVMSINAALTPPAGAWASG